MTIVNYQRRKGISRIAIAALMIVSCVYVTSSAFAEGEKNPSSPATRKYQERQSPFVSADFTKNTNAWKADNTVVRFVPEFARATWILNSKVDVVNSDGSVSKMTVESALRMHIKTFESGMEELRQLKPKTTLSLSKSDPAYEARMGALLKAMDRVETSARAAASLDETLMAGLRYSFGSATSCELKDLLIPGSKSGSVYGNFQDIRDREIFLREGLEGHRRYYELSRLQDSITTGTERNWVPSSEFLNERIGRIRAMERDGLEIMAKKIRDTPKLIDPGSPDAKLLLAIEKESLWLRRQIRSTLDRVPRESIKAGRVTLSVSIAGAWLLSEVAHAGEAKAEAIDTDRAAGSAQKQFDNGQSWARPERKVSH